MIYYISDIHFNDELVFKKCARPFNNQSDYEQTIVNRWNNKVNEDDVVYVLGDIAQEEYFDVVDILKKLNGHKHFIVGNHDDLLLETIRKSDIFESIEFIKLIVDNGRKVCLCHYPLMDWMEFNRNGYFVYGHVHNKTAANGKAYQQIKEYYADKPAYNAGVDVTGFKPVTLDEMIALKEKNINEPYIN